MIIELWYVVVAITRANLAARTRIPSQHSEATSADAWPTIKSTVDHRDCQPACGRRGTAGLRIMYDFDRRHTEIALTDSHLHAQHTYPTGPSSPLLLCCDTPNMQATPAVATSQLWVAAGLHVHTAFLSGLAVEACECLFSKPLTTLPICHICATKVQDV